MTTQKRPRADWKQVLLDYLRDHYPATIQDAVDAIPGMPRPSTIYNYKTRQRDPDWGREVDEVMGWGRKRADDTSWHAPVLNFMAAGLPPYKAVARVRALDGKPYRGLDMNIYHLHKRQRPEFAAAVDELVASERHRNRRALLLRLSRGLNLKDASAKAGVPLPTVKRWRRIDPLFDALVVEAAAEGGTRLALYRDVECPGLRCGTATGYDYGCRKGPCTKAKIAPILEKRKQRSMS